MHKPWSEGSLNQWLYYLENKNTQEIQLGLTRIMEVAKKLKVLNPSCTVITVGGTNGKGSTVRALETIYYRTGYKVGSYTSPHLVCFNERIRVGLEPISDEDLCEAFNLIEEIRGETHLTYFEFTTLASLLFFKKQKLDVLILEVGLGGRLDATNIINADLSIITTIDYDHQDFLGSTLEEIGHEKAGILRQGKPFIYADDNPPSSILTAVKETGAPFYLYGKDFFMSEQVDTFEMSFRDKKLQDLAKPKIQLKSATAAIVACLLLQKDLPIETENLSCVMNDIFIAGRLELIQGPVNILFDVAHNAQSARLLAETVNHYNVKGRVHAVFSALKDKDIFGLIYPLKDCVDRWYPAQLDNKRASTAHLLLSQFKEAEIFVETCYTNPLIAFNTALNNANTGDLIIVYGSFFTVSHVMAVHYNVLVQKEII